MLASCVNNRDNPVSGEPAPSEDVSFSASIAPIFTGSCSGSGCHIGERTSGVELTTYASIISCVGVQYGENVFIPEDASNSPLVDKIEPNPAFGLRMPRNRSPLGSNEINLIKAWINQGARNN